MAKGKKTGGKPQLGDTPKDTTLRVSSELKSNVERFRNLLDIPDIRDIALHTLDTLEAMSKDRTVNDN